VLNSSLHLICQKESAHGDLLFNQNCEFTGDNLSGAMINQLLRPRVYKTYPSIPQFVQLVKDWQMNESAGGFPGRYSQAQPQSRFGLPSQIPQELSVYGIDILRNALQVSRRRQGTERPP
jgi:hypothetical protein